MLAWSIIDFKQGFERAREYNNYIQELKWGTDFLIKAHISKFEMVGLIGNPVADHKKWVRPEDPAAVPAPSYTITAKAPGSELAAESAAALASASLVFSWANMQEYAQLCLSHAVELYEFATKYKGSETFIHLNYHTCFTYSYIYSE
jgi:endoglucanase